MEGVKITFVAKPIETAPKDKEIMVFVPDGRHFWVKCQFDPEFSWELYANGFPYAIEPTHWCYPHEMEVPNA